MNFTWWVNRKDRSGQQRLRGRLPGAGQHRSLRPERPLPTGGLPGAGRRHRMDGLLQPADAPDRRRAGAARSGLRGIRHQVLRAHAVDRRAMDRVGEHQDDMWDEEDGFFYDVLRLPDGQATRLKVRSMVGLLPLAAVAIFEENVTREAADVPASARGISSRRHPELTANVHMPAEPGVSWTAACSPSSTRTSCGAILARMLDENEFLGPHGIRALSRVSPRAPVRVPASAGRNSASATCRAIPTPGCSAGTPTGGVRSGCR